MKIKEVHWKGRTETGKINLKFLKIFIVENENARNI